MLCGHLLRCFDGTFYAGRCRSPLIASRVRHVGVQYGLTRPAVRADAYDAIPKPAASVELTMLTPKAS